MLQMLLHLIFSHLIKVEMKRCNSLYNVDHRCYLTPGHTLKHGVEIVSTQLSETLQHNSFPHLHTGKRENLHTMKAQNHAHKNLEACQKPPSKLFFKSEIMRHFNCENMAERNREIEREGSRDQLSLYVDNMYLSTCYTITL